MEIINSSVELYDEPNAVKKIERILRVCTKSEDKITETSGESIVSGCIEKAHFNICGHYHISIVFTNGLSEERLRGILRLNKYLRQSKDSSKSIVISGNIQAWRDWVSAAHECLTDEDEVFVDTIRSIGKKLQGTYPVFFNPDVFQCGQCWQFAFTDDSDLDIREADDYMTLKWTTDTGITHQAVRSRIFSFMQESSRYCNYSKKGLCVLLPDAFAWAGQLNDTVGNDLDCPNSHKIYDVWEGAMRYAEVAYNRMIELGCNPDEARSVLPKSTKSDIYLTASFAEWDYLISLRDDTHAHAQIQQLMPDTKRILQMKRDEQFVVGTPRSLFSVDVGGLSMSMIKNVLLVTDGINISHNEPRLTGDLKSWKDLIQLSNEGKLAHDGLVATLREIVFKLENNFPETFGPTKR